MRSVTYFFAAVVLGGSTTLVTAQIEKQPGNTRAYESAPGAHAVLNVAYPPALQERLRAALERKGPQYEPRTEHLLPDGAPEFTNRLILQDSPYLVQHAIQPLIPAQLELQPCNHEMCLPPERLTFRVSAL